MPIIGDFINSLMEFVRTQYFAYGYLIVLIGAYLKNTLPINFLFPIPASAIVMLGGIYAASGQLSFFLILTLSVIGLFLGSCTNYWFGRLGFIKFARSNRYLGRYINTYEAELEQAQQLVHKRGGLAIIVTHFLGGGRLFMTLVAGSMAMNLRRFLVFALVAALLWCLVFAGGGFFLGTAFANAEDYLFYVGLAIGALVLGGYFVYERLRQRSATQEKTDEATKEPQEQVA